MRNNITWVLPLLSNSWIIFILELYIALHRIPSIDFYWVGAVPKIQEVGASHDSLLCIRAAVVRGP